MARQHETKFVLSAKDKTRAALKSAETNMQRLDGIASKLTAGFGLLAGAGGMGLLISKQVEGARQVKAYSDALGLTTESLTAMQFASKSVGVGADKMADILKDVSEKISDAFVNDGGEAKEALENLNLSIDDMAKLAPDQQLLAIAGALGDVQTQGARVQIMESLASDASLLLPLLQDNAAELQRLTDKANATGAVLTADEVERLQQADKNLQEMGAHMDALAQSLAVNLAPYLTQMLEFTNEVVASFGEAEKAVQGFFDNLFSADNVLGGSADQLQEQIDNLESLRIEESVENGEDSEYSKQLLKEIELLYKRMEVARTAEILEKQFRDERKQLVIEGEQKHKKVATTVPTDDKLQSDLERLKVALLSEEEALQQSFMNRRMILDESLLNDTISEQEHADLMLGINMDFQAKHTAITEREAKNRARVEQAAQQQVDNMKQRSMGLAVGLLQTLGQKNKGFAIAAIALQKAIAIQQINVDAAKAHMAAKTLYSLGPGAPAALAAAAADIEAQRAMSIGLTVASGIAQASNVKSGAGGSTLGAPAPAADNTPTAPAALQNNAFDQTENQITIRIVGGDEFTEMVAQSIEQAEANDRIRIIRN